MSSLGANTGGPNSDGIAGTNGFTAGGGVVAITLAAGAGASGGRLGGANGLAAMLPVASGAASCAAASSCSGSIAGAVAGASASLVKDLPKSNTLPAICTDPTTMAMMLAAMNRDLTRFIDFVAQRGLGLEAGGRLRALRPRVRLLPGGLGGAAGGGNEARFAAGGGGRRAGAERGLRGGDADGGIGLQMRRAGAGLERLVVRQIGIRWQMGGRRHAPLRRRRDRHGRSRFRRHRRRNARGVLDEGRRLRGRPALGRARRAYLVAKFVFDRGQPFDDVAERAVHRIERILRARDTEFDVVDARRLLLAQAACARIRPHLFEVDQKVGDTALDPFQMAEPGVGGVELLHQLDKVILEMAEGLAAAVRRLKMQLLDLVRERLHQRFQPRRHRAAALRALGQRVGEHGDALLEMVERIAAAAAHGPSTRSSRPAHGPAPKARARCRWRRCGCSIRAAW